MYKKRKLRYKGAPHLSEIFSDLLSIKPEIEVKKGVNNKRDFFKHTYFLSLFRKDSPKNLIVMYDIPSDMRKERDWFRRHLRKFNYIMIQKSVWVGPSPLPKDFLTYVKSIGLKDKLKTFKLAKAYIIK